VIESFFEEKMGAFFRLFSPSVLIFSAYDEGE